MKANETIIYHSSSNGPQQCTNETVLRVDRKKCERIPKRKITA